jgi:uncharacterized protein YbcI
MKHSKSLTKGQIESVISNAITKFELEYMGRGPEKTKTYIMDNIIFVRLNGILTVAEKQLAKDPDGKVLIKQTRARLLEKTRDLLENIIENITGLKVISLHTDISTKTGERIIVFTLEKNFEKMFLKR